MTSVSTFPGLTIVVLLSLASSARTLIMTDLSACDVANITPLVINPQNLPKVLDFYVTGQTRELLPGTVSELITLTKLDDGRLAMWTTANVRDRDGNLICMAIDHVFVVNAEQRRLESDVDDFGFVLHLYLLAESVRAGQLGVFVQIFKDGVEDKNLRFIGLWSPDSAAPVNPTIVQHPVHDICGAGYDVSNGFFNCFTLDTSMKAGCVN